MTPEENLRRRQELRAAIVRVPAEMHTVPDSQRFRDIDWIARTFDVPAWAMWGRRATVVLEEYEPDMGRYGPRLGWQVRDWARRRVEENERLRAEIARLDVVSAGSEQGRSL